MSYVTNLVVATAVVVGVILGFTLGRTSTPTVAVPPVVTAPVAVPAQKLVEKKALPPKKKEKRRARRSMHRPVVQAAIGLPLPAPQQVVAEELKDYSVPAQAAIPQAVTETIPEPAVASGAYSGVTTPDLVPEDEDGHFGVKEYRDEPVPQKKDLSTAPFEPTL